jgi:hypothetical protein
VWTTGTQLCTFLIFFFLYLVLGIEPRVLFVLSTCFTAELQLHSQPTIFLKDKNWRHGSSCRAPALQQHSPEFKPQSLTHTQKIEKQINKQ